MVHRIGWGLRFRVVFGRAEFVWLQAEQGGDATRQAEDWAAVVKEERVMTHHDQVRVYNRKEDSFYGMKLSNT